MHEDQGSTLCERIQGLVSGPEPERNGRPSTEAGRSLDLIEIVRERLWPPIEAMSCLSGRLLSGPLSEIQRREAESLAQSVRHTLGALREVLDLHHLEAGEAEFAVERFDLHELVKDIASFLQDRASQKGLTSGVDMTANCPQFVMGDSARVRQALMALCETSLRSTSEGSIRLYVSANDASSPVALRFDLTDTSEGLSAAEQIALFQPSADTERSDGGLGLPIARRIAEAMGGVAGCDSAIGHGTLYWFTFQTVIAERGSVDATEVETEAANGQTCDAPAGTNAARKTGLAGHVLVVEHNTVNRLLIGAYLEEFGLTYEVAETCTTALMYLAAGGYDLVLMDMALPGSDGRKMGQRIRALQAPSSRVPIVALAAQRDQDNGEFFADTGVDACVAKPIKGQALYAALAPFLPAKDSRADIVGRTDIAEAS